MLCPGAHTEWRQIGARSEHEALGIFVRARRACTAAGAAFSGGRGRASSAAACPPSGGRTSRSSTTACRPRTRAGKRPWAGRSRGRRRPRVHPARPAYPRDGGGRVVWERPGVRFSPELCALGLWRYVDAFGGTDAAGVGRWLNWAELYSSCWKFSSAEIAPPLPRRSAPPPTPLPAANDE
jgi:hypothetical protein